MVQLVSTVRIGIFLCSQFFFNLYVPVPSRPNRAFFVSRELHQNRDSGPEVFIVSKSQ
jgi:hypothetical protein